MRIVNNDQMASERISLKIASSFFSFNRCGRCMPTAVQKLVKKLSNSFHFPTVRSADKERHSAFKDRFLILREITHLGDFFLLRFYFLPPLLSITECEGCYVVGSAVGVSCCHEEEENEVTEKGGGGSKR